MDKDTQVVTLTTQQKLIVDYLMQGRTLTNKVALTCLGIGSLSSRIAELRRKGYDIEDDTEVGYDERSFKKYFVRAAKQAKCEAGEKANG